MEWKFSHTWVCAYLVNNALNLIDVLALDRYFLKEEKKVVGPLTGSDLKLTVKICFTDRLWSLHQDVDYITSNQLFHNLHHHC